MAGKCSVSPEEAATAMLERRTIAGAARALGVSRQSVRRILAKPETQQILAEARTAVAKAAAQRVAGMFARGLATVDELLGKAVDDRTRLAAAKIAIELGIGGPLALPIEGDAGPGEGDGDARSRTIAAAIEAARLGQQREGATGG